MNNKNTKFLSNKRSRIEKLLNQNLIRFTDGGPKKFTQAIKYCVLNGGKRLRPLLIYAVGDAYNADIKALDVLACAIEFMHSFSLVHDDLPAMDDDKLRHGKPTCHVAYDEATAILAGDALSIMAFQIIAESKFISAEKKSLMISVLAEASGAKGMAAGQYIDLQAVGKKLNSKKLEQMYTLKTGCLIGAAMKLGALASSSITKRELNYLDQFAANIGLVFQIQDDVLNIEGSVKKIGKGVGTDKAANKITYPAMVGIKTAKTKIDRLWDDAEKILTKLNLQDSILHCLANQIMQRDF